MPAAMEPLERIGGVLVLDSEMAAVEADLDVLEQRAPGLVRGEAERRDASAGPPTGSSHRSKNSIVSVLVSSRQSGSGSMSRWMNAP